MLLRSYIIQEFAVILFVDDNACYQCRNGIACRKQVECRLRYITVKDYPSEIAYIYIDGIETEQRLELLREGLDRIEYRREIHEQECKDVIQVLEIAEHYIQRRKYKTDAKVKHYKAAYRIQQKCELPREHDSVDQTENKQYNEVDAEVDE